jgi:O-antigen/teichoic acid export membrane protein
VAAVQLSVTILENIAVFVLARRAVPWQRIRWRAFNGAVLRRTHSYSLLVLVSSVAALLYWKADNVVINKVLDPCLLTGYAVVVSLVLHAHELGLFGISVLGPVATLMHAREEIRRLCHLIYRANRIVVPWVTSLLLFLMVFGAEVLDLYVGRGYEQYAPLFLVLGTGMMVSLTQSASQLVPRAYGRIGLISLMSLIVGIVNVLLSLTFMLVFDLGLMGVALGTGVVAVLHRAIFWPWYTARMLHVPVFQYFCRTVVLPLSCALPFAGVVLAARFGGLARGWPGLAGTFVVAGAVELAFMLCWGLEQADRAQVRRLCQRYSISLRLAAKAAGF